MKLTYRRYKANNIVKGTTKTYVSSFITPTCIKKPTPDLSL